MNKTLLILTCITVFSCGKDPDDPIPTPNGNVSYKVNGDPLTVDNGNGVTGEIVFCRKYLRITPSIKTRYVLSAMKGPDNYLAFGVVTDSLLLINYHYDSATVYQNYITYDFALEYNGENSSLYFDGDLFDVNITGYNNSRISGTFSGKFTPISRDSVFGTSGSIVITEGVFNNVPVDY